MLCIEVSIEDKDFVLPFFSPNVSVIYHKHFHEDSETIRLLIDFAKEDIPSVTECIIKLINTNKHIILKQNGIIINNLNPENAETIIQQISKDELIGG